MSQYYKPRVVPVIRAEQWTGSSKPMVVYPADGGRPRAVLVRAGDWLVYDDSSGSERLVAVLSDEEFRATYEPVEKDVASRLKTHFIAPSPTGGVFRK